MPAPQPLPPPAVGTATEASSSASSGTGASSSVASPRAWIPGLLELPPSEQRRVQLSVRAQWPHISSRLADRAKVEAAVRSAVLDTEGVHDHVLVDLMLRHLERVAAPAQDLRLHELALFLAILVGTEKATKLSKAVLSMAEEGMEVSWYEQRLRKRYGG